MSTKPHPFDVVETMTPDEDDPEPQWGNDAYYGWLERTIEAATRKPMPRLAVDLAICLDRAIRAHEAEANGGPKCADCIARESDAVDDEDDDPCPGHRSVTGAHIDCPLPFGHGAVTETDDETEDPR